jgi:hypothetical protein
MTDWIKLVPPNNAVELFDGRLVGVNADNRKRLLFTVAFVVAVLLVATLVGFLTEKLFPLKRQQQMHLWARQAIRVTTAVLIILGVTSIWFNDPGRLATVVEGAGGGSGDRERLVEL